MKLLSAEHKIELTREERDIRALVGVVTIDEHRVSRMLVALLRDLRDHGLKAVIYLVNVDELDHDYGSEDARRRVRTEVEGVLRLRDAPVAFILNMRTYFAGVLPREVPPPLQLEPLPAAVLVEALDRRAEEEPEPVRQALATPDARAALDRLAAASPTPLAFLDIVHYLLEHDGLTPAGLAPALRRYAQARFTSLDLADLEAACRAFAGSTRGVERKALVTALGDEDILGALELHQAVLPMDFWSPRHFTLDPALQAALAAGDAG
jgi:hypothetical protein